jgi:competence protein ComEC
MAAFDVEEIWRNGQNYDSDTYLDFNKAVHVEDAEVYLARSGDTITAGDLTFTVLHPYVLGENVHNNSIVLELSYGDTDFLFMGDAEEEAEAEMIVHRFVQLPDVDILKVGNHCSGTSSTQAFLEEIRPEVAIYTAGEGNKYGYPHEEASWRLRDTGAEIYGTLTHGTVIVATNGVEYLVIRGQG